MPESELREALAAYAHEAWSGWMNYLFEKSARNPDGTVTIPAWAVERWTRQASTAYTDLPEQEKESDRAEADRMLILMNAALVPPTNPSTYSTPEAAAVATGGERVSS